MKAHRLVIVFAGVASVAALIGAAAAATDRSPDWLNSTGWATTRRSVEA